MAAAAYIPIPAFSREDMETVIAELGSSLSVSGKRLVAVFDGAEQIYLATLERIRKMMDRLNESAVILQVVLAGKPLLEQHLEQLSICNFEEIEERRFALKPLNLPETAAFLETAVVGDVHSTDTIDRIYQATSGNLEKTSKLAEKMSANCGQEASFWVLLEGMKEGEEDLLAAPARRWWHLPLRVRLSRKLWIGLGGVAFFTLLAMVLFLGKGKRPTYVSGSTSLHVVPQQQQTSIMEPDRQGSAPKVKPQSSVEKTSVAPRAEKSPINTAEKTQQKPAATERPVEQQPVQAMNPSVPLLKAENGKTLQNPLPAEKKRSPTEKISRVFVHPTAVSTTGAKAATIDAEPGSMVADPIATGEKADGDTAASLTESASRIPVISREERSSKRLVLGSGSKQGETAKGAGSTIVISSLAQSKDRGVTLIRKDHSKKKIHSAAANTAPAKARGTITVSPLTAIEKKREKRAESESSEVKKLVLASLKAARKNKAQGDGIIADSAKIQMPVMGAAIVPEQRNAEVEGLYRRRMAAGRSWLTGSDDDKYTIQLMVLTADNAESNIKQILAEREYAQAADNFYIFKKDSNPPEIFVFYGQYQTAIQARDARDAIPVFLHKHKPYVLPIKTALEKMNLD